MKDEDLADTNEGYVYLTQKLQDKEDEVDHLQRELDKLRQTNEGLQQHNQELVDDTVELCEKNLSLKTKLAEKERDLQATEERCMRFLKEKMASLCGIAT